jgi:hypothetical protein
MTRTRSKVRIPPAAAEALQDDLDDAIKRRSVVEIRAFAREAELSGLDQVAARGREIADVIEAKAGGRKHRHLDTLERESGRAELTRIKAASVTPEPTQAQLSESFDRLVMAQGGPRFDREESPDLERRRIQVQNEMLVTANSRAEEQRRAQVAQEQPEPEKPWWR